MKFFKYLESEYKAEVLEKTAERLQILYPDADVSKLRDESRYHRQEAQIISGKVKTINSEYIA